jgi:protein-S-isoprenylcysteine O-methyltransferase Ste14
MPSEPLIILAALLAFGVLHSVLAAETTKSMARNRFGRRHANGWYRLAYNIVAVFSLLPALLLTFALPDRELYHIPTPLSYITLAIQALGVAGMLYSLRQLNLMHFSGLRQARSWLSGIEAHSASDTSTMRLVVDGLHRYVRHPLYTNR